MPTKAKTFRVALSGATIDGREIKPEWLTQAAANYDPSVYAARVNVEHMRGVTVDGPFGAFGDITALRAETNKAGRVELYADIVPNDRAIAANKAGQKVYPSIEIIENFAGTGEAYVVGLALTDTPASTGTERLTFSAKQVADDATYTAKTFTGIGAKAGGIAFGLSAPIDLAATEDTSAADQLREAFAALRDKFTARFKAADKQSADLATEVAATLDAFADATAQRIEAADATIEKLTAELAKLHDAHVLLSTDFDTLRKQLETQPANHTARPASTGGNPDATLAAY